jgi:transposase
MKRCKKLTSLQREELELFIKTSGDSKEIRRSQSVLLVDKETSYALIESLSGFKERSVLIFRKRYLNQGLDGLEHKGKGRPKALLTKAQREEILTFLTKRSPKDHGYESDFWSTSILAHLIQAKYGVAYKSKKPFYLLFEEAKFSFHKPGQVYEKRNEIKVEAWKEEIKPKLEEAFQDPTRVILCADEMVLSTVTTFQQIWLKKGEYPKVEVSNTKKNKSIYGFLNIKTGREHTFIRDWQNMHITVDVLKEIRVFYPEQKILLIWDCAGWHRGSVVQGFIKEDGHIDVIYFPPYSPEENPQEHVWKAGRSKVRHNTFIPDIEKTANDFVSYLNNHLFEYNLLGFTARSSVRVL